MRAVVHEQIPGIPNKRARNENAACDEIDQRETNPYLPENLEDRSIGACVVQAMFSRREIVQPKAMNDIFGKGPRNDTSAE
jgi:hypothetical protein